ncbi:MAG: GNAT family N-acetyltransferase [Lachnospiraceae bacterium]|nr:GNAT family N-acetyltransferase [Lachnospiraceae bacterium]
MYIKPREVTLKNGQKIILRSPDMYDAEQLLEHMRKTSKETEFMSRYPEEITVSVETESRFLQMIEMDADNFMLAAYMGDRLVGNAGVTRVRDNIKYRHRATFGISLQEEVCGVGLGNIMLEEILEIAKGTSFEQLELSVFGDNQRAIRLYEKFGFQKVGAVPWAYRLKDGSYHDEVQMVYRVKK